MTLFEALTGGAFNRLNCQHSGEFDQNFSKKANAPGFARGGGDGRFWNRLVHYLDQFSTIYELRVEGLSINLRTTEIPYMYIFLAILIFGLQ